MNNNSDLKYLIALTHFPKFGPQRILKLKKYFHFWENAFRAPTQELIMSGIEKNISEEFAAARNNINPDEILEKLEKENIKTMEIDCGSYPEQLKEIHNPPALIYYRGQLSNNREFNLAVVGSRKYSSYGRMAVEQIVEDLVQNNLTIVSGLALGIDALAHNAALKKHGRTIAVLGSGLDRQNIYPSSNRYLADKIVDSGGAIISEFPIGSQPLKYHFPQRNRIISGLSLGTLVIEAGDKSGSLITAQLSLEQNREVFAVPGSIYSPNSSGTNELIKKGARLVACAADIMETLNLTRAPFYMETQKIIPETPEEQNLLRHLTKEPTHINTLIRLTKLDTNIINSTLVIMEMKGMVRNIGNMEYVLAR